MPTPASATRHQRTLLNTQLDESQIIVGDALEELPKLASDRFRCCVTSPPYWGLRDYDVDGQIGAEEDLFVYIDRLVEVFREVRRVLTDDGTLWLNIGDSYKPATGVR